MNLLVITGGTFDFQMAKKYLSGRNYQYVIAADGGVGYADKLGIKPNLILGDFDTLSRELLEKYQRAGVEILSFPPEKDYTDTHLAIEKAIEMKPDFLTILGATGTRLDHTLANLGLLTLTVEQGIKAEILDGHNRIQMMKESLVLKRKELWGKYISLVPYTEEVTGICLKGFRYPLKNAELTIGISRGISNELTEEEGSISIEKGLLFVIESCD